MTNQGDQRTVTKPGRPTWRQRWADSQSRPSVLASQSSPATPQGAHGGPSASVNDAAVTTCPHRAITRPLRARSRPIKSSFTRWVYPLPQHPTATHPGPACPDAPCDRARRSTGPPLRDRRAMDGGEAREHASTAAAVQSQVHVHPHRHRTATPCCEAQLRGVGWAVDRNGPAGWSRHRRSGSRAAGRRILLAAPSGRGRPPPEARRPPARERPRRRPRGSPEQPGLTGTRSVPTASVQP